MVLVVEAGTEEIVALVVVDWMVGRVGSLEVFFFLEAGLEVVVVADEDRFFCFDGDVLDSDLFEVLSLVVSLTVPVIGVVEEDMDGCCIC